MTPKEYKKKKGELGTILNTFDVEKLTEYMKTTTLFKASYKDNFLKSSEERRTMFMSFMIIDTKAPANVYPVTRERQRTLSLRSSWKNSLRLQRKRLMQERKR